VDVNTPPPGSDVAGSGQSALRFEHQKIGQSVVDRGSEPNSRDDLFPLTIAGSADCNGRDPKNPR